MCFTAVRGMGYCSSSKMKRLGIKIVMFFYAPRYFGLADNILGLGSRQAHFSSRSRTKSPSRIDGPNPQILSSRMNESPFSRIKKAGL
jgi:hypothetical protein